MVLNKFFKTSKDELVTSKLKLVISLLCANKLSFCHLPRRFSITLEPHCALKAAGHLFQNEGCFHHIANDQFGLKLNRRLCNRG